MATRQEIVSRAYREILGRDPDPGGLAYYLGRLRAGWSEARIRQTISRSPEARGRAAQPAAAPSAPAPRGDPGARGVVETFLAERNLSGEGAWFWQRYLETGSFELTQLEFRQRPAYKVRFAGMEELSRKGRAITEAQYIDNERRYHEIGNFFGLPAGFVTKEMTDRLIAGETSPEEWEARLRFYSDEVERAPAETKDYLERFYGVGRGVLLAVVADPDRGLPLFRQQVRSAQIAGAGARAGLGLERSEAERLAELGITEQEAEVGLGGIVGARELFAPLPGFERAEETIGRGEQIAATFEGNEFARERIRRRRAQRRAAFEGGGGFAASREGIVGLGTAST